MTPGVFLSYSTRDRAELENLLSALRRADEEVWFDEELGGGEVWWQKILERIRDCEVFLFALSNNSLQSKPCLTELRYAQALKKPVLPIQIGPVTSLRVTPLAAVEVIDFQTPTVDSGIRLVTAVQRAKLLGAALPSPLPEEPPVPFGYLMRLATTIGGDHLDAEQQAAILTEIESVMGQDGDGATGDIVQLLQTLRSRPDATETTRAESQRLLGALATTTSADATSAAGPGPTATASGGRRSRGWIIAAVTAVAVAAAIGTTYALRQRPAPEAAPAPAPTTTSAAPTEAAPAVNPGKVGSLLLTPAELNAITGMKDLRGDPPDDQLFDPTAQLSDPDCLGTDYAAAKPVYDGTGWSAVSSQTLTPANPDDPDTTVVWVSQAAVTFPTEHQAAAFRDKSATQWKGCSGKVVKDDIGAEPMTWTFDNVTADNGMISQISFQEGAEGGGCQHSLTTYSNVVLEAVVCGPDFQGRTPSIVAKMLEKARG